MRDRIRIRLVALRGLYPGVVGVALVSAGVGVQFGYPYGLITAGALLIVDTFT